MVDTEAGEDTMVAMVDSMAGFLLASARDFGLDIMGPTIRITGEVR